ncbi:hypothetical protein [uncultured Roseobacter sp.]|uniref:hypothetical protein n=1 Tax=uncultured Roseobacter sp. TaxID=114847 RepID=UPI0026308746|nr:hypothetical protein [uncultured Roseobacter sp.]
MKVIITKYIEQDFNYAGVENEHPRWGSWSELSEYYQINGDDFGRYLEVESRYKLVVLSIINSLKISCFTICKMLSNKPDRFLDHHIALVRDTARRIKRLNPCAGDQVGIAELCLLLEADLRGVLSFECNALEEEKSGFYLRPGDDFYLRCGAQADFDWDNAGLFVGKEEIVHSL